MTGEILSGSNRYVSVELDWELVHQEGAKLVSWVEETPIHPSELRAVEVCGETYLIGRTHEAYGYSVRSANSGFIPTSQTAGGVAEFFARVMIQAGVEVELPTEAPEVPPTIPPAPVAAVVAAPPIPSAVAAFPLCDGSCGWLVTRPVDCGCGRFLPGPVIESETAIPDETSGSDRKRETRILLDSVQESDQDYEWYPTTDAMIRVVSRHLDKGADSLLDIGAGDGRVLRQLSAGFINPPKLYAIEKSTVLIRAQPEDVIPVGTDLFEQNLATLPVDFIFCNPPYSQFETWACMIIESGYARKAFLVIPQRWKENEGIQIALKKRGATARVIHSGDFLDAPRKARAVVDIVEVSYPKDKWGDKPADPFDRWFDQNISTFDEEEKKGDYWAKQEAAQQELARVRGLNSIIEMVEAYREEYDRMEENYHAIFRLDYALLKELGVNKENVRDGIKKKMAGLKAKYWTLLFERLSAITDRLSTATKAKFLDKLLGQAILAFTSSNAYAVVLWAIKNANRYMDEQTKDLFIELSGFENVLNYKSNVRTWKKGDWRFSKFSDDNENRPSKYALDYRIVLEKWKAIGFESYDFINNLSRGCHDTIADVVAVLFNLGFPTYGARSQDREWYAGEWQDWYRMGNRSEILFQVKAHKNGNLHFRFHPDAIKALNIEAGRLLGWLRDPGDVVEELGYTFEEAGKWFGCTRAISTGSAQKLLGAGESRRGRQVETE